MDLVSKILSAAQEVPTLRVAEGYPFAIDHTGTRVLSLKSGEWLSVTQSYPIEYVNRQFTPAVTRAVLVATAFKIPNPGERQRLIFKDNDPTNCHVDNLTYEHFAEPITAHRLTEHYACRAVSTPLGEFPSIQLAADAHGITRTGMLKRVRKGMLGYNWVEK